MDDTTRQQLTSIVTLLSQLVQQGAKFMAILDDIEAEVGNQTTVEASIETLIGNLVTTVQNAGQDPTRLQAVLDAIKNNDDRLSALVVANTPAAPQAHVVPGPKHK